MADTQGAAADGAVGHTPGPWHPGHLCDDDAKCNCAYIFGGEYMGAIGKVYVDNGIASIVDGANDCPPLEEAKANQRLIAAAPDLLDLAKNVGGSDDWFERCADLNLLRATLREFQTQARAALSRATGV